MVTYQKLDSENNALFVDGIEVPIRLKRNKRARRIILRINEQHKEVHLTIPEQSCERMALDFLLKHKNWLIERLQGLPDGTGFQDGEEVPLRGVPHIIHHVDRNESREVVRICDQGEQPQLFVSGRQTNAPRRLKDWLKKQAQKDLQNRVRFHADRLGLTPKKLSIRDQKSRWGSCSSSGALSFSWRLILAPSYVLDYVAAHEVAHLQEMNHGPNFWKLVGVTMPDYEKSQVWLKVHGTKLHRYGQSS